MCCPLLNQLHADIVLRRQTPSKIRLHAPPTPESSRTRPWTSSSKRPPADRQGEEQLAASSPPSAVLGHITAQRMHFASQRSCPPYARSAPLSTHEHLQSRHRQVEVLLAEGVKRYEEEREFANDDNESACGTSNPAFREGELPRGQERAARREMNRGEEECTSTIWVAYKCHSRRTSTCHIRRTIKFFASTTERPQSLPR